MSDAQWELMRPVLEAWKNARPSVSRHQGRYELREIVNAIFYQARTGCQWRYLPKDLPPWGKTPGRKRGIATDVLGLIIAVVVVAASVHDNQIGNALPDKVAAYNPSVVKAWVDAGFKDDVAIHGAVPGIDVEVVRRNPADVVRPDLYQAEAITPPPARLSSKSSRNGRITA